MVLNKINLGDKTCLVVDKTPDYDEFCVCIEKDGVIWQDLAIVRKEKKDYEVLVYADENNEDYTHKFTIKEYKDD